MTFSLNDTSFIAELSRLATRAPERHFGTFEGRPLTFGDLDRQAESLAAHLRDDYGMAPGDRVAMMTGNSPHAIAALFGLARAGIVWVPVNARQRGAGLKFILEHSAPALLIVDSELLPIVTDCGADLPPLMRLGGADDDLAPLLEGSRRLASPPPLMADLYALMYTSGTTGMPKGVRVTHAMMTHALNGVERLCDIRPGDVFFQWEPFYHIGGAQMLLLPLFQPVQLALVERFSASRFWQQVEFSGATHVHYLGGVLQILLKQPVQAAEATHRVRIAWGGGCPSEIWDALQERFGFEIRECYGMTEASSLTTCNAEGRPGSVGKALPWLNVEIVDERGRALPPGETGQIVVGEKRPGVLFDGYFANPEASAEALRDGKLYTGDRGRLDADGHLHFLGRLTDSVRCRGENVSAWEVESVVQQHPGIEECAIVGVAADIGEQEIKLFVKPKPDQEVPFDALHEWLEKRLASYQRPRYFARVEAFEHTPSQRIIKRRLSRDTQDAWDSQGQ
ncbi:class I adenylate-forming enzyme family protein [Modicisalibacter coralii]|uniref:class I adenylate-forming enzyme family protein n=1 Tax=Modicisalibacter coralii TaxID=2304602 RepID=UPI00100AB8B0|nr:AMP-binding protein [Halomonas coralii]